MTELFDPGLQPERTHLAWRRTALGFLANAALVARYAHQSSLDVAGYVLAGLFALVGVLAMLHTSDLYERRVAQLHAGAPAAQPELLRRLWAATTVLSLGALALVALA